MQEILIKVLPIFIIIFIGFLIKKTGFFSEEMISGLKKAVMNLGLPAVLFLTFMRMDLRKEYIGITLGIFLLCVVFYFTGRLLQRFSLFSHPSLPFFLSAFAFGLVGIPLYLAVFGEGRLGDLSILGLGTELFIWLFFIPAMQIDLSGQKFSPILLLNIFKSHLILAVLAGLLVNIMGWMPYFSEVLVLRGFISVLNYFSPLATPLVLLIVGYELKLERKYMKQTVLFVLLRKALILSLGYLLYFLVIQRLTVITDNFRAAYFTILILPPPFSLALFISTYGKSEDAPLANNAVVLDTIVCFLLFIGYVFLKGI